MAGPDDKPLLVLDHVGKGRVAEMLSDQSWLWARGFEGGGPQAELLRRLAHWLMKEPELEDERLSATIAEWQDRRRAATMARRAKARDADLPFGKNASTLLLEKSEPGLWRAKRQGRRARSLSGDATAR